MLTPVQEFYAAVKTWPSDIYDVNSIITAVLHELENDEKDVLFESLAEL